jgi:hypothetical protein
MFADFGPLLQLDLIAAKDEAEEEAKAKPEDVLKGGIRKKNWNTDTRRSERQAALRKKSAKLAFNCDELQLSLSLFLHMPISH